MKSMDIRYPKARLSPAKQELVVIEFSRTDIEANYLDTALARLQVLVDDKEAADKWEGCATFFFSGWDDDPRETAEIPELRQWFGRLSRAFPYWFHVCEKEGDTVAHVFRLLCPGHVECVKDGVVGWRFEDLQNLAAIMQVLFDHQNELYERLGLSEDTNQRVSEEIAQILENSLN
jgi:hypothetical protein